MKIEQIFCDDVLEDYAYDYDYDYDYDYASSFF